MAGEKSLIVKLKLPSSPALAKALRVPANSSSIQVAPAKITTHFSQSQLALALAIQKAKPEELSTNEYCQQLRESIKTGQPIALGLRYIDTSDFWKEQYTRIHLEKKALEDKVHQLEEAQRQLQENTHGSDHESTHNTPVRQIVEDNEVLDAIENEGPRKRPAQFGEDEMDDGQAEFSLQPVDDHFLTMNSYVLRIRRHRSSLETATKNSSTLDDINTLAKHTIQDLSLLHDAITDTCMPLRLLKTDSQHQRSLTLLQQVLHQFTLSFLSCFSSMKELCHTIPGRYRLPEIVYRMVILFKSSLDLLHNLAKLQVEYEVAQESRRPKHKRSRTGGREYVVNKYLASSLATIFHRLEWESQQPGHADLLEGMLFSLLEHTGRLVSGALFSEHVALSNNPGNISKNDDLTCNGSFKHESRYLVQILHAALGSSARRELIAQVLSARLQAPGHMDSIAGSVDLFSKAKKLLQSTLVKSAVGGVELDTLRLPTPPIEDDEMLVQVDDEVEKYGSEWLIESVWGIIGWDMIA